MPVVTFERSTWSAELVKSWECSECSAGVNQARHRRRGELEARPYNMGQVVCGEACARARKTRLQAERRERQRGQTAAAALALDVELAEARARGWSER